MKHTYDMIGYAKQLQNDLKEFNGVYVTINEIIKEHDLKPNLLYTTNNELGLLETKVRRDRKMKTREEIRDWLLANAVDESGNLDISELDFSDFKGYVDIGNMKVKGNLYQDCHEVKGSLYQGEHEIKGSLFQNKHDVKGELYQSYHEVKGDLFQNWHDVEGDLYQTEHKVKGDLIQSDHEIKGDLHQSNHDIDGNLHQSYHEVGGNYYSKGINVTGKITFEEPKKALKEVTVEELEKMGYKIKEEEI